METLLGNLSLIIPSIVIKPHRTRGPETAEERRLLILNNSEPEENGVHLPHVWK